MEKGHQTHTIDVTGKVICLGDVVDYDFEGDDPCPFEVVFEGNAFRKKYKKWDKTMEKPILEYGHHAKTMKLKIVKSFASNTDLLKNSDPSKQNSKPGD